MTHFMPMLPPEQNELLFGPQTCPKPVCPAYKRPLALAELDRLYGPVRGGFEPTKTRLPSLGNLPMDWAEEHFGSRYSAQVVGLSELAQASPEPPPVQPVFQAGWTRYEHGTGRVTRDSPQEPVVLFDTETYVKGGGHPVIGVAASTRAWYVWLHESIGNDRLDTQPGELIPGLGGLTFVAHNAMFDMSKTEAAYGLANQDRPYAVCTMALHTAMSGLGGDQVLRAYKSIPKGAPVPWVSMGSTDGLAAVLEHYTGRTMSKDARSLFVEGSLANIVANRKRLLAYALSDVYELWHLWASLWPKFRQHCPSNFTLSGLLEASRTLLPVVDDWHGRISSNNAVYSAKINQFDAALRELADKQVTEDPTGDPWLSQLDWTPARSGKNKGMPLWYRKLKKLSLKATVTPLLLKMSYRGEPLVYDKVKKWGYYDGGEFKRLPHKDGHGKNVGSPLSKDFAKRITDGTLTSAVPGNYAQEMANLSYWSSYQTRFEAQYAVQQEGFKAIVPLTKLLGTLTGRQVEKTWLTAAQTKPGKLGSDLFHAVQAPKGWAIVAWDEDTEEVRLASLYGDAEFGGGLGSTPMSQSAFMGCKADKTDAHSITAKVAQIHRQEAKVANFRDIYGGGFQTQADALQAAHPDWPASLVAEKVHSIMKAKRGAKTGGRWSGGTDSQYHNAAGKFATTKDFRLFTSRRQLPHIVNCRYDTQNSFYTSRYNFPTQGAGVDILHLTLSLVPWLAEEEGIPGGCWSYIMARHDEVAYLVRREYAHRFAELGHTAHTLAWACYFDSLGFNWLPTSACRLGGVNIDWVYRKEPMGEDKTELDAGYGLGWSGPDGEVVT